MFKRFNFSMSSQTSRKSFLALNLIVLLLIISYFIISPNIETNNSSQTSPLVLTIQQFSIDETIAKIVELDRYLKAFKPEEKDNETRLLYPNEIQEMTTMTIDKTHCTPKLGADLLLLVMVLNRVEDFDRRQTIRQTWGQDFQTSNKSKLYFAVGLSRNESIQREIKKEDQIFHDIIQWSYYESYYNCTIKVLGILRWTALNCPLVKFVIKVDDDSLLVSDNLLSFCNNMFPNTIYGHLWRNPKVFRNITSKWAITTKVSFYYYCIYSSSSHFIYFSHKD